MGEEFKESTEGGEVNEAGARIVIVRSSDVKFEAWSVRTWNWNNSVKCQQTVDSIKSSSDYVTPAREAAGPRHLVQDILSTSQKQQRS